MGILEGNAEAVDLTDLVNADWTKGSLDLVGPNGLVSSVAELEEVLETENVTVAEFKALPAYALALERGDRPWLADL